MRHFSLIRTRTRAFGALAAALAAVTVLGTAGPASASLSSSDWTKVALPSGYFISRQTAVAPDSCVRGTQFCMVLASNSADVRNCVSATTCWLTGLNGPFGNLVEPILMKTPDLGVTWQDHSNLPDAQSTNPDISYALQDISCVSAASCVAVGGPNQVGGKGTAVVTSDGGRTWIRFASAKLDNFQSVSCVRGIVLPTCFATGTVFDAQTGGDDGVTVVSPTGGLSWTVQQNLGVQGPFFSMTCTDASHCWAGGNGGTNALDGTANGGRSWSLVTSSDDITNLGDVACLSVNVCVATTDNGLWLTTDDGGLAG